MDARQVQNDDVRARALAQLDAILLSAPFARSARRKAILSFIVRCAFDNPPATVTAATIAAAVYDSGGVSDGDPEGTVRVEMTRVRTGLDTYYSSEGWNSPVRISIPKGSYTPVFQFAEAPPVPEVAPATAAGPTPARRIAWVRFLAAALLVAAPVWYASRHRSPEVAVISLPGTQRQPSVSPDGEQVAFVWDGERGRDDIFTARFGTHAARRLTNGPEPASSPAWSPDGRLIAFFRRIAVGARAIYIVPVGAVPGQQERLLTTVHTSVTGLAWTPDSRNVVISDSPEGVPLGLHLVSVATGARQPLVETLNTFHPAISRDGRALAFISDRARNLDAAVYWMPLRPDYLPAGPARLLAPTLAKGLLNTRWSFDGRSIYYTRPVGMAMRYSLDSGKVEPMGGLPENIGSPIEYEPAKFVYVRMLGHSFIGRITPGTERPVPSFQTVEDDEAPDLSPDGRYLVFTSRRDGKPGLWFADPDGRGAVRTATTVPPIRPRWSPDSKQVCFSGTLPGGHSRLFVAAPGVPPRMLAVDDGADQQFPFFSRTGRYLYFSSNRGGPYRIWRIQRPDGAPQQVTQDPASHADESPDGQALYYSSGDKVIRITLGETMAKDQRPEAVGVFPQPTFLRVTPKGLYVEVGTVDRGSEIRFQPFDKKDAPMVYKPGMPIQGWSPVPGEDELLTALRHTQAEIERRIR